MTSTAESATFDLAQIQELGERNLREARELIRARFVEFIETVAVVLASSILETDLEGSRLGREARRMSIAIAGAYGPIRNYYDRIADCVVVEVEA